MLFWLPSPVSPGERRHRLAQEALGHNSKAVHHAYSKHAEVTVPSLDDWEKDWQENPQRNGQSKLLPVDFRLRSGCSLRMLFNSRLT
jgi:hypothetical protein